MWMITRDYISTGEDKKETGKKSVDFDKEKANFKFRLLDDDGIVYYHGIADKETFSPLNYYSNFAGCTEIQYQNELTKKWETL